jgi:hypothetical protein
MNNNVRNTRADLPGLWCCLDTHAYYLFFYTYPLNYRLSTRRTGRAGYQAIKEDKMGLTMQNWRLDRHVLLDWMDTAQLLRDQLPSSLFMLTADDSASTGW